MDENQRNDGKKCTKQFSLTHSSKAEEFNLTSIWREASANKMFESIRMVSSVFYAMSASTTTNHIMKLKCERAHQHPCLNPPKIEWMESIDHQFLLVPFTLYKIWSAFHSALKLSFGNYRWRCAKRTFLKQFNYVVKIWKCYSMHRTAQACLCAYVYLFIYLSPVEQSVVAIWTG